MKTAVIKTGGKQFYVHEKQVLKVEKLPNKVNDKILFKDVLLTTTDKTSKIGTPTVAKATVEATILKHGKKAKVTGVKMKPKKRSKHYFGHRQPYTEIQISNIKTT